METFISLQMVLVAKSFQWITFQLTRASDCEPSTVLWNGKWFGWFLICNVFVIQMSFSSLRMYVTNLVLIREDFETDMEKNWVYLVPFPYI